MLPPLTSVGDLPPGIYPASWHEIEEWFGKGSEVRARAFERLKHLHELAALTGKMVRFLIFGSFVSAGVSPRDVDVVLIMATDFKLEETPRESRTVFFHADAEARFGASVFWVRENMLPHDLMQEFFDTWQTKRDGSKRGIVEVAS